MGVTQDRLLKTLFLVAPGMTSLFTELTPKRLWDMHRFVRSGMSTMAWVGSLAAGSISLKLTKLFIIKTRNRGKICREISNVVSISIRIIIIGIGKWT